MVPERGNGKKGNAGRKTRCADSLALETVIWRFGMGWRECQLSLIFHHITNEYRPFFSKGLQFYHDLTDLCVALRHHAKSFVSERTIERETLVSQAEAKQRRSAPSAPPAVAEKPRPPPPPPPSRDLDSSFASMNLRSGPTSPPVPPPPVSRPSYSLPPPPPPPPAPTPLRLLSSRSKSIRTQICSGRRDYLVTFQ